MSDTGFEYGENHYVVSAARMNAIMQSIIIFTVRTHGRLSRKTAIHRAQAHSAGGICIE